MKRLFPLIGMVFLFPGCTAKFMKTKDQDQLKRLTHNEEFEQAVKIVAPPDPSEVAETDEGGPKPLTPGTPSTPSLSDFIQPPAMAPVIPPIAKAPDKKKKPEPPPKKGKKVSNKVPEIDVESLKHQPDIEDEAGFQGRRPIQDPFRIGETVLHNVRYNLLPFSAGTLTFKVNPFAEVNGRRSYSFVTLIKTYENFSRLIYSADDRVVTLMDFETLVPSVFTLHVKETSQLREARSFFDSTRLQATYWEKKVTEKNGVEEKKQQWEILPYSQNVFSALYYMRVFKWETGKQYAFRVADDEQNLVFKGTAVRRETINTEAGSMKTVVVKAEVMVKGMFKQVGDIHIWLSDDDRKLVLRIESKIKIGSLVSEVVRIDPGQP